MTKQDLNAKKLIIGVIKEELKYHLEDDGYMVIDVERDMDFKLCPEELDYFSYHQFVEIENGDHLSFEEAIKSGYSIESLVDLYIKERLLNDMNNMECLLAQHVNVAVLNTLRHCPEALDLWQKADYTERIEFMRCAGYEGIELDTYSVTNTPEIIAKINKLKASIQGASR